MEAETTWTEMLQIEQYDEHLGCVKPSINKKSLLMVTAKVNSKVHVFLQFQVNTTGILMFQDPRYMLP